MSGADLDLVVRARRAVVDGALRPCPVGVRGGRIAAVAGYDAAPDAAALRHRNAVSAYHARRLIGVVRRTWLRGRLVDGEPAGRLLRRAES